MKILGFSNGHDKGAVLIINGKIVCGISQERLTRVKGDGGYSQGALPFSCMKYCLDAAEITFRDIDLFVYSTTEIVDNVEEDLNKFLKFDISDKIIFIPHHLAHAYSSFFSSNFESAVVIVADASGSILNYQNKLHEWYQVDREGLEPKEDWTEGISIYHMNLKDYKEVYKKWIKYPVPEDTEDGVSVGTQYSIGSLQLIYEPRSNSWPAGKLMGLASYAKKELVDDVPLAVQELEDDIFIPCKHIYPKVTWKSDFFSRACVAGAYQREQERASLILAKMAKKFTGEMNVCVAGGSFLNCNSNQLILESGLFENCYFIPPSDDSGIPLGCAYYGYQYLQEVKKEGILKPYLGKSYSRNEIIKTLNEYPGLVFEEWDDFDALTVDISYWLTQNRVVGWFQGGGEIGPRALGNRSIIASPIEKWMTGHINSDVKGREWYRPFAPAVLFEHQSEVFESDVFSPYMLVTTTVKEEWRDKIPAVTHIDNSARHQSVTPESNEKFYKLISKFYEKTNVPVLLNTSFNGPGDPMVETPKDAIDTFLKTGLDILVIENFIIRKKDNI